MTKSIFLRHVAVGLALLALPVAAPAQGIVFATPTPGLCLLGRAAAIGASRAGQGATRQMQQIVAGITAELTPQRQAIQQESAALQAGRSSIPAAQLQQRLGQLQQRALAFEQLDRLRGAQILRTRRLAEQQIAQMVVPALGPIVTARKCAVVKERDGAYGWNNAMDVTQGVVQELDRRLPAIQVTLATPQSVATPTP